MNPAAALYQRLKDQAGVLDEASFVRRYAGWYFFSQLPISQQDRLPFVTEVHSPGVDPEPPAREEPADTGDRIWKLEKSRDNAWKRRISVGRANNNDIVIRHESVSKLHAHFHTAPSGVVAEGAAPPYLLVDVGSANGTTVNGDLMVVDVPVEIRNQDRLVFGTVSGRLLDAGTLHRELNALDWF